MKKLIALLSMLVLLVAVTAAQETNSPEDGFCYHYRVQYMVNCGYETAPPPGIWYWGYEMSSGPEGQKEFENWSLEQINPPTWQSLLIFNSGIFTTNDYLYIDVTGAPEASSAQIWTQRIETGEIFFVTTSGCFAGPDFYIDITLP